MKVELLYIIFIVTDKYFTDDELPELEGFSSDGSEERRNQSKLAFSSGERSKQLTTSQVVTSFFKKSGAKATGFYDIMNDRGQSNTCALLLKPLNKQPFLASGVVVMCIWRYSSGLKGTALSKQILNYFDCNGIQHWSREVANVPLGSSNLGNFLSIFLVLKKSLFAASFEGCEKRPDFVLLGTAASFTANVEEWLAFVAIMKRHGITVLCISDDGIFVPVECIPVEVLHLR